MGNQDVYLTFINSEINLFAILDGHGRDGLFVAQFAARLLEDKLVEKTKHTACGLSDLGQIIEEIDLKICEHEPWGGALLLHVLSFSQK